MTLFRSTGSSQGAKDFFEFWKIFSFWKYVLEYAYYFFYINTFTSAPKRTLLFFGVMNFAVVKNLFWDKQLIVGILEVNIFWKKLSVSNTLMRLIFFYFILILKQSYLRYYSYLQATVLILIFTLKHKPMLIRKGIFLFQVYLRRISSINAHWKLLELSKDSKEQVKTI